MKQASDRFFNNPAFREYLFLLVELHRLIREGRDETAQGWAVNDAMDHPGDQLDGEEIQAVKVFAADLYQLTERHRAILDMDKGPPPGQPGSETQPAGDRRVRSSTTDPADSPKELIP